MLACLVPMIVICLPKKYNFLFQLIWGPMHYVAPQGMPVEASDCSANIPRNIVVRVFRLVPIMTYPCDLLVCILRTAN